MINETLIKISRDILKKLLELCNEKERKMFNRMYYPQKLDATIEEAINHIDRNKIDLAITQCQNTLRDGDRPYLIKSIDINVEYKYNPKYGDDRECECGHPYYRHFDTYEQMEVVGCKYCHCGEFKEQIIENTNLLKK